MHWIVSHSIRRVAPVIYAPLTREARDRFCFFACLLLTHLLFDVQYLRAYQRKVTNLAVSVGQPCNEFRTSKELFDSISKIYNNASNTYCNDNSVIRGRKHSVSSMVEDLFAFYLRCNLPSGAIYRVDQPITCEKKQLYPDITIVRENIVSHMVDIKMDLGWCRHNFDEYCLKRDELIGSISGHTMQFKDSKNKDNKNKVNKVSVKSHKNLCYHIVIISGLNISKDLLNKHIESTKNLKQVKLYILYRNTHPNDDKNAYIKNDLDIVELERLIKDLSDDINM